MNPASLENLKPFEKGNPGGPGRPRKRPVSEAYDDHVRELLPTEVRVAMKLKPGATWADAIAVGLARKAVAGDVGAAKEIREAVEGKATQRIELVSPEDRGFEVRVEYAAPPKMVAKEVVENNVVEAVIEAVAQLEEDVESGADAAVDSETTNKTESE